MLSVRNERYRLGALVGAALCVLAGIGFGLVELTSGSVSKKVEPADGSVSASARLVETTVSAAPLLEGAPPIPRGAKLARLEKLAMRAAVANEDAHPYRIEVVPTNARAVGVFGRHRPVYLVIVYGHFICRYCSAPFGVPIPIGTIVAIIVDAKTSQIPAGSFGDQAPATAGLGPVVTIDYRS